VKTRDKKRKKLKMRVFLKKTIYSLLQVHFPENLILDSESSVNFTSEMPIFYNLFLQKILPLKNAMKTRSFRT